MNHLTVLKDMLSYKRPHGGPTEWAFIARFITPLLDRNDGLIDAAGNVVVITDPESKTLFTAHVDSCHRAEGFQQIGDDGHVLRTLDANCLGADDMAGVFIMIRMIEHKVPGTYAFMRGEEQGGIGARYMATHNQDLLSKFDRAIAFDRAGYSDVITHQAGDRCCSDEFAEALSDRLNEQGLLYMPCDTGVYTDTAEFIGVVPECSNLSVGYRFQHSERETQDYKFLFELSDACLAIDWESLPTKRDPREVEQDRYTWGLSYPDVEVEYALDDWYEGCDDTIRDLIADALWPEDPPRVYKFIDMSRMDEDVAVDAYQRGVDALIDALVVEL